MTQKEIGKAHVEYCRMRPNELIVYPHFKDAYMIGYNQYLLQKGYDFHVEMAKQLNNKIMTKEEAQKIVDNINEDTIIDNNWLDYLVNEPCLNDLLALQIVTGMNWSDFIKKHEGCYITDFQTKKEIYVGRIIFHDYVYQLITFQNNEHCGYLDKDGKTRSIHLSIINNYLV